MLKLNGFYSGRYQLQIEDYTGLDFSRRAFIVPGQSAAYAGMYKELARGNAIFQERLAAADRMTLDLGWPSVSEYVLAPEKLALQDALRVKNLALFCVQVSTIETLIEKHVRPAVLSGHSFGEFAAMTGAGVIAFDEALEIVAARDRFSPPAKELGSMIVAAASRESVEAAFADGSIFLSNVNSPHQTVLSVRSGDVEKTLARLKKLRIPAQLLSEMPQPYHSPLMAEVAVKLGSFLRDKQFEFKPPLIPFVSSVTGGLITSENFEALGGREMIQNLIEHQLTEPVDFARQIKAILAQGVLNFIEVGPGEICTAFIKETLEGQIHKISPLSRFVETAKVVKKSVVLSTESSGLLSKLSKVIASVTGYRVEEISVQDNFQEDLGIDSIRKAEIVFKFLETMNAPGEASAASQINLAQMKRIEDVIEHFELAKASAASTAAPAKTIEPKFERYEEEWVAAPISDFERLAKHDLSIERLVVFSLDEFSEATLPESELTDELLIFVAGNGRSSLERQLVLLSAFRKLQARTDMQRVRIALVHGPGADPAHVALDGLFKCWFREAEFLAYRNIESADSTEILKSKEQLSEQFLDPRFTDIRFIGNQRFGKRWVPSAAQATEAVPTGPVVLSIGGAKGIGAVVLEELAKQRPSAKIFIVGRSEKMEVASSLERISSHGPAVRYLQADATDADELRDIFRALSLEYGGIDLVFCGAGKELSRSLAMKTDAELREELSGKVIPASTVFDACHDYKVARLVNYSSIAAEFGNVGQTVYAYGNGVMANLGQRLRESTSTRAITIVLPPWKNLGMTENPLILAALQSRGISLLSKEVGARLVVTEALGSSAGMVAVLDANDARAYDADLIDRSATQNLFSSAVSTLRAIPLRHLNCEDQPYLRDHVVKGNKIYPASSAFATMYYAAYLYLREAPVLEACEVLSFLAPQDVSSDVSLEIVRLENDRVRMQIVSPKTVHYCCEAVAKRRVEATSTTQEKFFARHLEIQPEPLYSSRDMMFGRHFQLADQLWFDETRRVEVVSRESRLTRYTQQTKFDRLQQWFELTLQVIGGQLLWNTQRQWVPSKIKQIVTHFESGLTQELRHYVEIVDQREEVCRARAWMVNARGETLLEMREVDDIDLGKNQGAGQFYTRRNPSDPWRHEDIGM